MASSLTCTGAPQACGTFILHPELISKETVAACKRTLQHAWHAAAVAGASCTMLRVLYWLRISDRSVFLSAGGTPVGAWLLRILLELLGAVRSARQMPRGRLRLGHFLLLLAGVKEQLDKKCGFYPAVRALCVGCGGRGHTTGAAGEKPVVRFVVPVVWPRCMYLRV